MSGSMSGRRWRRHGMPLGMGLATLVRVVARLLGLDLTCSCRGKVCGSTARWRSIAWGMTSRWCSRRKLCLASSAPTMSTPLRVCFLLVGIFVESTFLEPGAWTSNESLGSGLLVRMTTLFLMSPPQLKGHLRRPSPLCSFPLG